MKRIVLLLLSIVSSSYASLTRVELVHQLDKIDDPQVAQKLIHENIEVTPGECFILFEAALKEKLPLAQLHCANTYQWIRAVLERAGGQNACETWNELHKEHKDFLKMAKPYIWAPQTRLGLHSLLHQEASPYVPGYLMEKRLDIIIAQARKRGSVFAALVAIASSPMLHFGTACELAPFFKEKTLLPELVYLYGYSIYQTGFRNIHQFPELTYYGLAYMEKSGLLSVDFVGGSSQDLDMHCNRRRERSTSDYVEIENVYLSSPTVEVMTCNQETWKTFKEKHLVHLADTMPMKITDLYEQGDMQKIREDMRRSSLKLKASTDFTSKQGKFVYFFRNGWPIEQSKIEMENKQITGDQGYKRFALQLPSNEPKLLPFNIWTIAKEALARTGNPEHVCLMLNSYTA